MPSEQVLPGFREQAVELVRPIGKPIAHVARDLQINDTTLGNWVKADQTERGVPDSNGLLPLTAAERAELTKLRRKNAPQRRSPSRSTTARPAPKAAPPAGVWLVRLRRGPASVIIATGLGKPSADYLAEQVNDLLHPQPVATGGAIG